MRSLIRYGLGASLITVALVACNDAATGPRSTTTPLVSADVIVQGSVAFVGCPQDTTLVGHAVIGPQGGTLSVGDSRIDIPAGVLTEDTPFTMTVPAGSLIRVDVSVDGVAHYQFSAPVSITIGYSRCRMRVLSLSPYTAWYIDSNTLLPIAPMGGDDNRSDYSLTFTTNHLSGYAIAY
ncbi:MAG: hypothetical protein IRY91_08080 [Gemmatimonadaceae bacterium]|nr:hypothetical protein [Gemmatimonadaceae bacterium]